jgi:hypothetical protein
VEGGIFPALRIDGIVLPEHIPLIWRKEIMKRKPLRFYALLLVIAVSLIFVGVSALRVFIPKGTVRLNVTRENMRPPETIADPSSGEIERLKAELKQLEHDGHNREQESAKLQNELDLLRSQLVDLRWEQTGNPEMINSTAARDDDAGAVGLYVNPAAADLPDSDASDLTPEEEIEQADAQMWAQIDVIEEAIMAEDPDPDWAQAAVDELDGAYQGEEMAGAEFVSVECRTTMCRMELALTGTKTAEETFRSLADLAPWEGQGFVQIEDGELGQVVVYLAREGHSLPQVENDL